VAEIVPPWKKIIFKNIKNGSKLVFDQFFFPENQVITTLSAVAGCREHPWEQA